MSDKKCIKLPSLNKNSLFAMIEALRIDLLENEKIMEDILKNTPCNNNYQLENQINTCFELRCKLEDYQEKLEELEFKGNYTEPSETLMNFISNINNVINDSGPEALIIVPSEEVGKLYINLLRRLSLKNVVITTIRALTAGDVHVTLGNVNTALLDGSDTSYRDFVGSTSVQLVVSDRVPADRLYFVRGDEHREACFQVFAYYSLANTNSSGIKYTGLSVLTGNYSAVRNPHGFYIRFITYTNPQRSNILVLTGVPRPIIL